MDNYENMDIDYLIRENRKLRMQLKEAENMRDLHK